MNENEKVSTRYTFPAKSGESSLEVAAQGEEGKAYALLIELLIEAVPPLVAKELTELHELHDHSVEATIGMLSSYLQTPEVKNKIDGLKTSWQLSNAILKAIKTTGGDTSFMKEEQMASDYSLLRRSMTMLFSDDP